jgi:hypothetical protein
MVYSFFLTNFWDDFFIIPIVPLKKTINKKITNNYGLLFFLTNFFMLILGIHVSGKGDTERGRRKGKKKPSKGCYQGRWQRVKIL